MRTSYRNRWQQGPRNPIKEKLIWALIVITFSGLIYFIDCIIKSL